MATVNFSVPDNLKKRFNEVFANENKSHIIADLMETAIAEHEKKIRRAKAIDSLFDLRKSQKSISLEALQKIRKSDRP